MDSDVWSGVVQIKPRAAYQNLTIIDVAVALFRFSKHSVTISDRDVQPTQARTSAVGGGHKS